MFVVTPGQPPCDNNTWSGNTYGTAFPACTTSNGRQVAAAAGSPVEGQSNGVVVHPDTHQVRPVAGRMSG